MSDNSTTPSPTWEALAKQLHHWYLEATKDLDPDNFNPNAQKSYDELTEQQQFIDRYIANKVGAQIDKAKAESFADGKKVSEQTLNNVRAEYNGIGLNEGIAKGRAEALDKVFDIAVKLNQEYSDNDCSLGQWKDDFVDELFSKSKQL